MSITAQVFGLRAGGWSLCGAVVSYFYLFVSSTLAEEIEGQVLGGGAPISKSMVTLWSASDGPPKQLGQAQAGDDGRFTLSFQTQSPEGISYLIAKGGEPTARKGGDNPAIALLSVTPTPVRARRSCPAARLDYRRGYR